MARRPVQETPDGAFVFSIGLIPGSRDAEADRRVGRHAQ
jgi:hypothetical protein